MHFMLKKISDFSMMQSIIYLVKKCANISMF